ncbi:MAG: nicotinate-nucleotide adenylyltransferase [Cyclobacteriaceae bacterium]
MKVGLFFGSFNPIHAGHLIIAQTMYERSDVEEIWFIVSPQNPLKKSKSLLHEFDRYDMVELAIREQSKFKALDVEFSMPKPSYTIDTLTVLAERYPENTFRLIMGGDNLKYFGKWKNSAKILEHFGLLVYPRPNQDESLRIDHENIEYIQAPRLDISATFIRDTIKKGFSLKYLVPESVANYIDKKQLYL